MVSMSAKSAGSSSAADAPWRTSSARTRSRTRPCSSPIIWSVEAVPPRAYTSIESFVGAGTHSQGRGGRGDDFVFLLQAECHPIVPRQPEGMIAGVAALDVAL